MAPIQTVPDSTRWEENKQTGIKREIHEGYDVSPDLPGSIKIPSHKGEHGAQMGEKVEIPMIIDPDRPDGGIIIRAEDMRDRKAVVDAVVGTDDPTAAYEKLSKETVKGGDKAMAKKSSSTAKSTKTAKATQPTAAEAAPEPAEEPETVSVEDQIAQQCSKILPGIIDQSVGAIIPQIVGAITDRLQPERPGILEVQHEVPAPPAPAPEPDPQPEEKDPEGPPPKVQVAITDQEGGQWITHYHEVIKTGAVVVLVYDTSFKYGSRIYPPTNVEKVYHIAVQQENGSPEVCHVRNWGLTFGFHGYEMQVMVIEHKPPEAPEQTQ